MSEDEGKQGVMHTEQARLGSQEATRAEPPKRIVNLRDLGFVGSVSDRARAEIARNERRALRVLETAHLFWFR